MGYFNGTTFNYINYLGINTALSLIIGELTYGGKVKLLLISDGNIGLIC